MHMFSIPFEDQQILMNYLLQRFIQIFHFVGSSNVPSSIHSRTAMHIDDLLILFIQIFLHFFHQGVKFIKTYIVVVPENNISDEQRHTGWIDQGTQNEIVFVGQFYSINLTVRIEVLLFDVSILGFLGCEEVQQTDHNQLMTLSGGEFVEGLPQLLVLKFIIFDGKVAPHQKVIVPAVNYFKSVIDQVSIRAQEEDQPNEYNILQHNVYRQKVIFLIECIYKLLEV